MKWRRISESDVLEVLRQPERTENSLYGRTNAFKHVGNRLLKITWILKEKDIEIVTAIDKT
jgi:hypothetical protein